MIRPTPKTDPITMAVIAPAESPLLLSECKLASASSASVNFFKASSETNSFCVLVKALYAALASSIADLSFNVIFSTAGNALIFAITAFAASLSAFSCSNAAILSSYFSNLSKYPESTNAL